MIKVLFATETFAVGINAPTKTVVFTSIKKPTKSKLRILFPQEYTQMAGRAGRRGLDVKGTVILLFLYGISDKLSIKNMMLYKVHSLKSKFHISYNFVLKMFQKDGDNINIFLNKTLYSIENNEYIANFQNKILKIKEECDENRPIYDIDTINLLNDYYEIEKSIQTVMGIAVKITKKQRKKNERNKRDIKSNIKNFDLKYKSFTNYKEKLDKLQNMEEDLIYYSSYVENKIINYTSILRKFNYIKDIDQSFNIYSLDDILPKGILAAQINDCNSLLMTEIITQKLLYGLTSEEIASLFAIFIEDFRGNNKKTIGQVTGTLKIHETLRNINKIINVYQKEEKKVKIDSENEDYWNIYYDHIDSTLSWISGKSFQEISHDDLYEGNFVRNMLKINNIAKDVIYLCKIYGDMTIIPQLEKIEELIIRDIVTIDSLYL